MNNVIFCFLGLLTLYLILILDESEKFKKYAMSFASLQKFGKFISLGCFLVHLPQSVIYLMTQL